MSVEPANPFAAPRLPADGVGYAASYGLPPAVQGASPLGGGFHGGSAFTPQLRPLAGLGRALRVLLGCHVLAGLASAAVAAWSALTYATLSGLSADTRLGPDVAASALMVVTALLSLTTGLVFMAWMFNAARNVEQLGVAMRYDTGWAVAAWFVPFLNLVRPKRMMDDIWRGSMPTTRPGTALRHLARPGIVTTWWATWLLAGALSTAGAVHVAVTSIQAQLGLSGSGAEPVVIDYARLHETQAVWSLWASAASVAAACCAIAIVRRVTSWQRLRAEATPAAGNV